LGQTIGSSKAKIRHNKSSYIRKGNISNSISDARASVSGIGQGSSLGNSITSPPQGQPIKPNKLGAGIGSVSGMANASAQNKNDQWKSSSMNLKRNTNQYLKPSSREKLPGITIH